MSWFSEEQATDYLGLVTGPLCTAIDAISGGLAICIGFAMELPMVVFEFLCSTGLIVFEFLCSTGLIVYEFIVSYALLVSELLGLNEWWGVEHTVLVIWMAICLPAFCKRSPGNCQEILLQTVGGLYGLLVFGSVIQLVNGVQGGVVFNGQLAKPTLAILAVVTMMFGANIDGIKKEIYGYGVGDAPTDEKCAKVFDAIKKLVGLETVIFLAIATFGLPAFDLEAQDHTPWICAFPIIGLVRAMNTYFAPEVEAKAAEVAEDLNGTPPQAEEVEKKVEEEAPIEGVKEEVQKIEGETAEQTEEKAEAEPEKVSLVSKVIGKVKGLVACGVNLVLAAIDLVLVAIAKVKALIGCVVGHVLSLPWDCILNTVICLGTKATFTYCLWYLTLDCAVVAFPLIDLVIPFLIGKAKERELLTNESGHLISETALLAAGCTQYYLFRTYIQQPI